MQRGTLICHLRSVRKYYGFYNSVDNNPIWNMICLYKDIFNVEAPISLKN